ncbi:MAG: hypothetical protein HY873_13130 [Chloroflexi bacterium]|nr:hypothetical protein [Chloroflexota bacterium]
MPGAAGQLKKLYQQLIGGTAPTDAEAVAGSVAAMVKYEINRMLNGTAPSGAASLTGDMSQMMKALVAQILNGTAPAGAASSSGDIAQMVKYLIANSGSAIAPRQVATTNPSAWGAGSGADALPYTDWIWTPTGFADWTNAGTPADLAIGAITDDFMSSADMDNGPSVDLNSSGDMIHSGNGTDQGFGEWKHARAAGIILGAMPDKLELEWIAQFATASANEPTSGFGFVQASALMTGALGTKAAVIASNGTNFTCTGSVSFDTGAAVDTNWHIWKIVLSLAGQNVEWYIDGVSQGTFAISTDIFPVRIGAHAFTTNRLRMGPCRVRYAA